MACTPDQIFLVIEMRIMRYRRRWENEVKIDLQEIEWEA
jgi:hypothetical protein